MERRRLLHLGGTSVSLVIAGCASETDPDDPGADDGDGTDDEGDDDGPDDADETDDRSDDGDESDDEGPDKPSLTGYDTVAYSDEPDETGARLLRTEADAADAIDAAALSEEEGLTTETGSYALGSGSTDTDEATAVGSFVEETDFVRSLIALLRLRVANHCYGIEVGEVTLSGDDLSIRASGVDERTPEQECAAADHAPTVLVRATFEDEIPSTVTTILTDMDGGTHEFEFDRDADRTGENSTA